MRFVRLVGWKPGPELLQLQTNNNNSNNNSNSYNRDNRGYMSKVWDYVGNAPHARWNGG